jgi:hypothetical protein
VDPRRCRPRAAPRPHQRRSSPGRCRPAHRDLEVADLPRRAGPGSDALPHGTRDSCRGGRAEAVRQALPARPPPARRSPARAPRPLSPPAPPSLVLGHRSTDPDSRGPSIGRLSDRHRRLLDPRRSLYPSVGLPGPDRRRGTQEARPRRRSAHPAGRRDPREPSCCRGGRGPCRRVVSAGHQANVGRAGRRSRPRRRCDRVPLMLPATGTNGHWAARSAVRMATGTARGQRRGMNEPQVGR